MQILVNGLISGLTISVLAVAFSIVFLPTRIFHIALGGIFAAVPYVAWTCLNAELPWVVAIGTSVLVAVVLSVMCESFNHAWLERRGASSGAHLIASLGIFIIIVQVVALTWGNQTQVLRVGVDQVFSLGEVIITRAQVISALTSLIVLGMFFFGLRFSNLGLQFRAMSDNPKELALRGYNINKLRVLAFIVSGILAGAAALVHAYDFGFHPYGGFHPLLLAVVAVIIGGRQSFLGPVLGGLILGVVRSEVVWFLSARWQDAVTFLLLALFLYVRPNGIVGRKVRLEAEA